MLPVDISVLQSATASEVHWFGYSFRLGRCCWIRREGVGAPFRELETTLKNFVVIVA